MTFNCNLPEDFITKNALLKVPDGKILRFEKQNPILEDFDTKGKIHVFIAISVAGRGVFGLFEKFQLQSVNFMTSSFMQNATKHVIFNFSTYSNV